MKISSTVKGLITGLLMVAAGLVLYFNKVDETSPVQYVGYLIYGLGIVWTITAFVKNSTQPFKFGTLFNQGFRCFVVVALIMAIYTFSYFKLNPQEIDQIVEKAKIERIKTTKDRTPAEIESEAAQTKKYYIPIQVAGVIFYNLFIGVVVTIATAGSLYLRNKKS